MIIRTTVVYGWDRGKKNFVHRILRVLGEGGTLEVPSDQIGTPTYAPNLAEIAVELAISGKQGIYNVVGSELADRYELAMEVARVFGLATENIRPVSTEYLKQKAKRPLEAGMYTEKVQREINIPIVGYREGLREMAKKGG